VTAKKSSSKIALLNGTDGEEEMKTNAEPTPNPVTGQAPKILTVEQVAHLLQIPKSSIYEKTRVRLGAAPPLPCRRVGKYLRFFEAEVMAWLTALPQNCLVSRKRHGPETIRPRISQHERWRGQGRTK
jgi:predicted DNA-binding transcriptional regulator AlpA